jgi:hypothetical protein
MTQIDQPQSGGVSSSGQVGDEARPAYGPSSQPLSGTPARTDQPVGGADTGISGADTGINGGQQSSAPPGPEPIGSGEPDDTGAVANHALLPNAEPFRRRWESVQVGFVDNPVQAVDEAEALVSSVMDELVAGFRTQHERLEAFRSDGNDSSTDELRDAFRRYRDFFERLLQV